MTHDHDRPTQRLPPLVWTADRDEALCRLISQGANHPRALADLLQNQAAFADLPAETVTPDKIRRRCADLRAEGAEIPPLSRRTYQPDVQHLNQILSGGKGDG